MKNRFKILFAALAAAVLGGCATEELVSPEGPEAPAAVGQTQITVTIPGAAVPTTRAIAGGGGEAVVSTIDILVFEDNELTERVVGREIKQSGSGTGDNPGNGNDYRVTFVASLTPDADATQLVILANAATQAAAAAIGAEKQDVLAAMTVSDTDGWKATSSSDYDPIPMYGEKAVAGIAPGIKIDGIELTRMLARIDVVNSAASNFTLMGVTLYGANTKGYVAPAWNTADGTLSATRPAVPMIPAGQSTAIIPPYASTAGANLIGDIYAFESAAATGGTGTATGTGTFLVIEGIYGGIKSFYRVDLTDPEGSPDPEEVPYMPVFRNHLYRVEITQVDGVGYKREEDAANSQTVLSNLKTNLLVVDQRGINDIVFDGQYWLGITSDTLAFSSLGGTLPIDIRTNYSPGWEESHSGTPWYTFGTGANNSAAATITVPKYFGTTRRTATFDLVAGRLTQTITVVQDPTPPNIAAPGVIGYVEGTNELTLRGSVDFEGSPVEAAAETMFPGQGLHEKRVFAAYFKWGSLIAMNSEPNGTNPGYSSDRIVWAPVGLFGAADAAAALATARSNMGIYDAIPYADDGVWPVNDVAKGVGDPCELMTEGGKKWRTPSGNPWYGEGDAPFGSAVSGLETSVWASLTNGGHWVASGLPTGLPVAGGVAGNGTSEDWSMFLPNTGTYGEMGLFSQTIGMYWSSTRHQWSNQAHSIRVDASVLSPRHLSELEAGYAIRCVPETLKVLQEPTPFHIMGGSANSPGREQRFAVESNTEWEVTTTDIPWLQVGIQSQGSFSGATTGTRVESDLYNTLILKTIPAPAETIGVADWYRPGTVTVKSKNGTFVHTIDVEFLWGGYGDLLYFEGTGDNAKLAIGRWGDEITETNFKDVLAYFKFGSVIGSVIGSNAATSPWTFADNVRFNPSNLTAGDVTRFASPFQGDVDDNNAVYAYFERAANNQLPSLPGYTYSDIQITDISANTYHNAANIRAGKGDPCRLVGLTAAEIRTAALNGTLPVEQGWRLPTARENVSFAGGPGDSDPRLADWTEWRSADYDFDVNLSGLYQDAHDQWHNTDPVEQAKDDFELWDQSPYYDIWSNALINYDRLPVADGYSVAGSQKMPIVGQISSVMRSNANINGAYEISSGNMKTDMINGVYDPLDPYDDETYYWSSSVVDWGVPYAIAINLMGEFRVTPTYPHTGGADAVPVRCVRR